MREILRDEVQLTRSLQLEQLRFADYFVEGEGAMLSPHQWNRAEGATVIAPFADLHVANVRKISRVKPNTGVKLFARFAEKSSLGEFRNEPLHLGGPKKEIDFGQHIDELLLVALDHASNCHDRLAAAVGLEARCLDHRVDRFLLGGVDEAAGVDDDYFGVSQVRGVLGGIVRELREIALAVDGVLVAAECDDADFHAKSVNGNSRT